MLHIAIRSRVDNLKLRLPMSIVVSSIFSDHAREVGTLDQRSGRRVLAGFARLHSRRTLKEDVDANATFLLHASCSTHRRVILVKETVTQQTGIGADGFEVGICTHPACRCLCIDSRSG